MEIDVIVAGLGAHGSSAAYRLAARGASVLGFDCHSQGLDVRRRVGYLPAEMPIYPELTNQAQRAVVKEMAAFYGVSPG